jgi:hypothetical protein
LLQCGGDLSLANRAGSPVWHIRRQFIEMPVKVGKSSLSNEPAASSQLGSEPAATAPSCGPTNER